jgi:hypothetical protein
MDKNEAKDHVLNEGQENEVRESDIYLDEEGKFLKGDYVLEQLGITEKSLYTLGDMGEFGVGRIAGRIVVNATEFLSYLDRVHFKGRTNPDDEPAIVTKGKVKKDLTLVNEPHTSIPKLYPIHYFAEKIGLDDRTFIRHCDTGTFFHYRIGSLYKMSHEDWIRSLGRTTDEGLKSNRGGKKKAGRPSTVQEMLKKEAEKEGLSDK